MFWYHFLLYCFCWYFWKWTPHSFGLCTFCTTSWTWGTCKIWRSWWSIWCKIDFQCGIRSSQGLTTLIGGFPIPGFFQKMASERSASGYQTFFLYADVGLITDPKSLLFLLNSWWSEAPEAFLTQCFPIFWPEPLKIRILNLKDRTTIIEKKSHLNQNLHDYLVAFQRLIFHLSDIIPNVPWWPNGSPYRPPSTCATASPSVSPWRVQHKHHQRWWHKLVTGTGSFGIVNHSQHINSHHQDYSISSGNPSIL